MKQLQRRFYLWMRSAFGRSGEFFSPHGIQVRVPQTSDLAIRYLLSKGRPYEEPEAKMVRRFLPEGTNVIELGGCFGIVSALIRDQIGLMVNDVLDHTNAQIKGFGSVAEVRGAGRQLAGFSPQMKEHERTLKAFMYKKLYYHPEQVSAAERARDVVARLFAAYSQDSKLMPAQWHGRLPTNDPDRSRMIADFIAGMSDRFAMQECETIYGERPQGLSNV